jgi:hypothetical protein
VDEGVRVIPTTARWLALATAVLLAAGVVSAGVVDAGGSGSDAGVVNAASNTTPTVDVPSSTTTTVPSALPPVTQAPPSTVARSTTVPKAAAAVLAAIGTTAPPTTRPPATTTTRATVPPTTATTATTSTTSTTITGRGTVTFVNGYPNAVRVTVGGETFPIAVDGRAEVEVALAGNGKDIVTVQVPNFRCETDLPVDLAPGGTYRVVAGTGQCGGTPKPRLEVGPA